MKRGDLGGTIFLRPLLYYVEALEEAFTEASQKKPADPGTIFRHRLL
jgi:hypothetical protein